MEPHYVNIPSWIPGNTELYCITQKGRSDVFCLLLYLLWLLFLFLMCILLETYPIVISPSWNRRHVVLLDLISKLYLFESSFRFSFLGLRSLFTYLLIGHAGIWVLVFAFSLRFPHVLSLVLLSSGHSELYAFRLCCISGLCESSTEALTILFFKTSIVSQQPNR